MKYIIDRIEGVTAVCAAESGSVRNLPLRELYEGAGEGDHFQEEEGSFVFLPEETEMARKKNTLLQDLLFE